MADPAASIETPSGKGAGDENFPVGSWLIARPLRPHVAAFYAFARAADDIADSSTLSPKEKVTRLALFDAGLSGEKTALRLEVVDKMRQSLAATGIAPRHCRDLLSAFTQDATKTRYQDWGELIDYCNRSAAPVGRYLIDLHRGPETAYGPSDALCNALQILNHLQDCKDDYLGLDRVYLPLDDLAATGARLEDLAGLQMTPGLRAVHDRLLDGVGLLLDDAAALPERLARGGLARESAVILAIARSLSKKLRRHDPIAKRVELSKPVFLACFIKGALFPTRDKS